MNDKGEEKVISDRYFDIDERWDELCRGELNDLEKQRLKTLASSDPIIAKTYEAFEPLGDEFNEQLVDFLEKQQSGQDVAELENKNIDERPAEKSHIQLVKSHTKAKTWGSIFALAASVLLVFSFIMPGQQMDASYGGLPNFNVGLPGANKAFRGADKAELNSELPSHSADQRLELLLRPEEAIENSLVISTAIRLSEQSSWQDLTDVKIRQSKTGSVKLSWLTPSAATRGSAVEVQVFVHEAAKDTKPLNLVESLNSSDAKRLDELGRLFAYKYRID